MLEDCFLFFIAITVCLFYFYMCSTVNTGWKHRLIEFTCHIYFSTAMHLVIKSVSENSTLPHLSSNRDQFSAVPFSKFHVEIEGFCSKLALSRSMATSALFWKDDNVGKTYNIVPFTLSQQICISTLTFSGSFGYTANCYITTARLYF